MHLILLGCPGAGKGTQAKWIKEKFHIPSISTGDILRDAILKGTELGKKVKVMVDNGMLVPDDIMIGLVANRIKEPDCKNGFLLDGFPRTVAQAKALHELTDIDYVIDIDVAEEEVVKRLSGRRIHPQSGRVYHITNNPPKVVDVDDATGEPLIQRPDDIEETVRKRLAIYNQQTRPLREFYHHFRAKPGVKVPHYFKVNGAGSVEDIKDRIANALKSTKKELL